MKVIGSAIEDKEFSNYLKLNYLKAKENKKMLMEALLQHYGYSTHFLDVVDNHWVALWFGLNRYQEIHHSKKNCQYCFYEKRTIVPVELANGTMSLDQDVYQYLILVAVDNNAAPVEKGIIIGNDIITIDLRSSLPSYFLRPHTQHGLVIRRNRHEPQADYDLSRNVVAIARLRIDRVSGWLGDGVLLSNDNLFPSPAYDYGYEILLNRKDLFENYYHRIANYI